MNLTEVGRVLKQLGIVHIAAYSPEARGRSERAFQTHQGRLPQELERAAITDMISANRYLDQVYRPAYNREFCVPSTLTGSAYVPFISGNLPDILCEQQPRIRSTPQIGQVGPKSPVTLLRNTQPPIAVVSFHITLAAFNPKQVT